MVVATVVAGMPVWYAGAVGGNGVVERRGCCYEGDGGGEQSGGGEGGLHFGGFGYRTGVKTVKLFCEEKG